MLLFVISINIDFILSEPNSLTARINRLGESDSGKKCFVPKIFAILKINFNYNYTTLIRYWFVFTNHSVTKYYSIKVPKAFVVYFFKCIICFPRIYVYKEYRWLAILRSLIDTSTLFNKEKILVPNEIVSAFCLIWGFQGKGWGELCENFYQSISILSHFGLLIWTLFIGPFVHPEGEQRMG